MDKEKRYQRGRLPHGSPLAANGIPEDVVEEALERYFSGEKLVIHTPFLARPAPEQRIKRTVAHVSF
jgi:hypothetical protein